MNGKHSLTAWVNEQSYLIKRNHTLDTLITSYLKDEKIDPLNYAPFL